MIETISPLIKKFLPFAQERMGFEEPPKLFLKGDNNNAEKPLGKTAYYDPQRKSITIYITGRHPKDVMRSLSHELVHHSQNCRGDFEGVSEMGEGYAQNDPHLREMEREAYEVGNMCFRDWEDSIKSTIYFERLQKGEKKMSLKDWKNKEISGLLAEAWGFKFNTLQEFEEFDGTGEIQEVSDQEGASDAEEESRGKATDTWEKEGLSETGDKDTGASEDDDSKTHPGEKDYTTKKGDELKDTEDKGARGEDKGDKADVNEVVDEESIDEMAAKRQGNEDRDVGRDRMHVDRMHEEEEVDEAHVAGVTPRAQDRRTPHKRTPVRDDDAEEKEKTGDNRLKHPKVAKVAEGKVTKEEIREALRRALNELTK